MLQEQKKSLKHEFLLALIFALTLGVLSFLFPTPVSAQTYDLNSSSAEKQEGDRFNVTDFNTIFHILKNVIFYSTENILAFNTNGQKFGFGTATVSGDLTVDVAGKIGATQYCDADGNDCILPADMGGVGGVFVGATSATTDGSMVSGGSTGYAAANALCAADFSGSHICSVGEIASSISDLTLTATIVSAGVCPGTGYTFYPNTLGDTNDDGDGDVGEFCVLTGWTGEAWISGGPSKYGATTVHVDDCEGWTYDSGANHTGNFWNFDYGTVGSTPPQNGGVGGVTTCNSQLKIACCKKPRQ
ncbi:MAG: hypothetical protein K9M51_02305 [Candidatus Gracilibacteria bacterium]|nr:hypothetical protein [Candidatus Gracilibacteria bacterium]